MTPLKVSQLEIGFCRCFYSEVGLALTDLNKAVELRPEVANIYIARGNSRRIIFVGRNGQNPYPQPAEKAASQQQAGRGGMGRDVGSITK